MFGHDDDRLVWIRLRRTICNAAWFQTTLRRRQGVFWEPLTDVPARATGVDGGEPLTWTLASDDDGTMHGLQTVWHITDSANPCGRRRTPLLAKQYAYIPVRHDLDELLGPDNADTLAT